MCDFKTIKTKYLILCTQPLPPKEVPSPPSTPSLTVEETVYLLQGPTPSSLSSQTEEFLMLEQFKPMKPQGETSLLSQMRNGNALSLSS